MGTKKKAPKFTAAQQAAVEELITAARKNAYEHGRLDFQDTAMRKAREELAADRKALELDAVRAATQLIAETTKLASRAGYLLGKALKMEGF